MSFIDLATLALHRRNEMEARINVFSSKCDLAIQDIIKLKMQAHDFVNQLNCEPSELKDRFLKCMRGLDEYMYLMTDFNLSVSKLEETVNTDFPVRDTPTILKPISMPINIIDFLSEPAPSTSKACHNACPIVLPKKKHVPKEEQTLILFSSSTCSSESFAKTAASDKSEKEVQCNLKEATVKKTHSVSTSVSPPPASVVAEPCNLPAQTLLQAGLTYPAIIMNIDGASLWIVIEDAAEIAGYMREVTVYYKNHYKELMVDDVTSLTNCAYYDKETDCYYRALFIKLDEDDESLAEVFLVDTGEVRVCEWRRDRLCALAPRFCGRPPYARCCHLAGIELINSEDKEVTKKQDEFLMKHTGTTCQIEVDDNTSESLGVYVILSETENLNQQLVDLGYAYLIDEVAPPKKEVEDIDAQLDITNCPEYEDPVMAVTGYSNRDEAEICKHYKGPPEKTCFKGARCTKKHILMHPDGWTLDRVAVTGKCPTLPVPAPDSWLRVTITCICHFDHVYLQLVNDDPPEPELPGFGIVLPPANLTALVQDMNSPAARVTYKPLALAPACGELVAAIYPPDNQWYRARVISATRADQTVEVQYIDFGNKVWVREDGIRSLEARHALLPAQALPAALAGVRARSEDSREWRRAKEELTRLALDKTLHAHVIAREFDEMTVELIDEHGNNIAQLMDDLKLISLHDYSVVDDSKVLSKQVVP